MDSYKVLVPNLARRDDRWLLCAGVLLGQGVPLTHIERFVAHDGAYYRDTGAIAHSAKQNMDLAGLFTAAVITVATNAPMKRIKGANSDRDRVPSQ